MSLNICQTCGERKRSFQTRAEAKSFARLEPAKRLRVYRCGPYWHLTSADAHSVAWLRERAAPK